MATQHTKTPCKLGDTCFDLSFLDAEQIAMIDSALQKVGDFGEVRLILEKGNLRFVVVQQSYDARHWQPE